MRFGKIMADVQRHVAAVVILLPTCDSAGLASVRIAREDFSSEPVRDSDIGFRTFTFLAREPVFVGREACAIACA